MYLNTLIIKFKEKITYGEIPLFRGAIINAVGEGSSVLFHNHEGENFRYRFFHTLDERWCREGFHDTAVFSGDLSV